MCVFPPSPRLLSAPPPQSGALPSLAGPHSACPTPTPLPLGGGRCGHHFVAFALRLADVEPGQLQGHGWLWAGQAASRGNSRFEYCNAWQSACVRRWAAASGRAGRAGRGLPRFNPGCDTNHGALQVLPLADDHARRPLHHGQRLAREQGLDHESDCKCPALPTSGSARSLFCARCVRAAQPPGACLRSKQQVVHACPS